MKKDIELRKDNILLRPYRSSDAKAVYDAATESVEQAGKWLPWCHPGYMLKESKDWIKICAGAWKKGTAYEFGVFDAQNGRFLGGGAALTTSTPHTKPPIWDIGCEAVSMAKALPPLPPRSPPVSGSRTQN